MPMLRKLATIATAAEAARRYAKRNPDKAAEYLDQAARFVDKQTKGRYSGQITGAARKVKSAAGIRETGGPATGYGPAAGNGHLPGAPGLGTSPEYGTPAPGPAQP